MQSQFLRIKIAFQQNNKQHSLFFFMLHQTPFFKILIYALTIKLLEVVLSPPPIKNQPLYEFMIQKNALK